MVHVPLVDVMPIVFSRAKVGPFILAKVLTNKNRYVLQAESEILSPFQKKGT